VGPHAAKHPHNRTNIHEPLRETTRKNTEPQYAAGNGAQRSEIGASGLEKLPTGVNETLRGVGTNPLNSFAIAQRNSGAGRMIFREYSRGAQLLINNSNNNDPERRSRANHGSAHVQSWWNIS
jgi:hypothetical protein